jgi:galactonate dehydratase
MKITEVRTYLVNADHGGRSDRPHGRNWLFVKVFTDEGITGVGEGGGWPEVVEAGIRELSYFLIGENPFDIERLWTKLYYLLHSHGLTGAVRGGVISAIDMALWDIKGKALGVPVYELLGGKYRDRIPVYSHASTVERAQQLIERGIKIFKCAPSVQVLKTLREACGDDVEIGVHCHGEFTAAAAIQLGKACEPYRPAFFEEPTSPDDVEALAKVAEKVDIPIAAGERLYHKWSVKDLLYRQIIDIFQPEITRIGGITESKKTAIMCEAYGVKVAPHDGSAGPIAEMANIHFLASIPNVAYLEHRTDDVPWRFEVVTGAMLDVNGFLEVPTRPGLGIDINEAEIAKHPPRAVSAYQYREPSPEAFQQMRAR